MTSKCSLIQPRTLDSPQTLGRQSWKTKRARQCMHMPAHAHMFGVGSILRRYRTTSCFPALGPQVLILFFFAWSELYNFVLGSLWNRGLRGLWVTQTWVWILILPLASCWSYCKFLYALHLSFLIDMLGITRVLLQSSAVIAKYVNIHSALRKFPGTQYTFTKYLVLLFNKWQIALL